MTRLAELLSQILNSQISIDQAMEFVSLIHDKKKVEFDSKAMMQRFQAGEANNIINFFITEVIDNCKFYDINVTKIIDKNGQILKTIIE